MAQYRADIDGLRGLSILAVMLFHAGFGVAPGGYVGVDVFFVISGYLITSLIHGEIVEGRFSLVTFYERRVRRLFPALCVVLASCAVLGAVVLLPRDFEYFGGSLLATTAFASNVFFWLEAGYFDLAAERKLLLHTWSLAVEEQFYLLFPLCLLLLHRILPRRLFIVTAIVSALSLAASEWGVRHAAAAAFYLTPFRAWELGLGALLVLAPGPRPKDAPLLEAGALLGLVAIGWSVARFSAQTAFPGVNALLPCAGAALLIWTGTGGHTRLGRVLQWRPLVFVGLISYSLYLWHWPLLVFARHVAIRELTILERVALLGVAVIVAAASWRFIERPFRGPRGALRRRTLFVTAAAASATLFAAGIGAVLLSGWPQRLDPVTLRMLSAVDDINPRRGECSFLEAQALEAGKACRLGAPTDAAPSFVVWGDSHADTLMPTLDRIAADHGQSGTFLGRFGCPPLLGVERGGESYRCREFAAAARRIIEAAPDAAVVLVARWSHFTSEPTYGREEPVRMVLFDDQSTDRRGSLNDGVLGRGLERTLAFLDGRRVYVVLTVPEIGIEVPAALAQAHRFGRDLEIRPTVDEYRARQRTIEALFAQARSRHEITLLSPADELCASGRCSVAAGGLPLYFDGNHLTVHGADQLSTQLQVIFAGPAAAAISQ